MVQLADCCSKSQGYSGLCMAMPDHFTVLLAKNNCQSRHHQLLKPSQIHVPIHDNHTTATPRSSLDCLRGPTTQLHRISCSTPPVHKIIDSQNGKLQAITPQSSPSWSEPSSSIFVIISLVLTFSSISFRSNEECSSGILSIQLRLPAHYLL